MAFVKPEKVKEGIKILVYGDSGSGKTPFVLSFPHLALADADGSSTFYKDDCPNIDLMTNTGSIKEVTEEFEELECEDEMFNGILSIGIDSISRYYENLQHAALKVVEQRARKNARMVEGEGLSQKEWGVIKLHYDRFMSKLMYYSKLGKNIIVVAEGKDEKEAVKQADGTITYVKKGITYNSSKGAEFDFDIVLEFTKDGKGGSLAKVVKDRTKTFQVDDVVEMANYKHWENAIEKAQQGRQRSKDEIKNIDDAINRDAESFDTVDDSQKKIDKVVEEIKKVATQKVKELKCTKAEVAATFTNSKLEFKTVEEANECLNAVKNFTK